ncbi:MAG TPA: hypothetical protein VFO79_03395 [Xanthomonadales bacterium]|nr:hypothetical protein [Xanthomonadales bacterium]
MRPAVLYVLSMLAASVLSGPAHAADEFVSFTGQAVDQDDGTPLYTENYHLHLVDGQLRERVVVYTCPDATGKAFARKVVQVNDPFKPTFELVDQRRGYIEGFDAATSTVRFRAGADAEVESAKVEDSPTLVVDSGFDEFVLRNWDTLMKGDRQAIDFVVPSQQEALTFKIKHLRAETIHGRPAEVFRLALTGLLGLIASGIDVAYDTENRNLLRFEGLSNLRDADGDNYTVRIDFPPSARTTHPDRSALDAAKALPLDGACP